MIRISLAYVYQFTTQLEPILGIQANSKVSDNWFTFIVAQMAVEQLLNQSVFAPSLRASRQSGLTLAKKLAELAAETNPDREFAPYETANLNFAANHFKTILLAEMETLNANFVTQKRGYDTLSLMTNAEIIFPPDLPSKVPDSIFDVREAGKCIAFELPTAAGFHLHRANEAILHRYYDAVTDGKERPKGRNIGDYLAKLKEHKVGDSRLLAALSDLKDMHRNPLIHPEQTLESIDEAIALMGSIHNAVVYMLKAIHTPPAVTPSLPASALSSLAIPESPS